MRGVRKRYSITLCAAGAGTAQAGWRAKKKIRLACSMQLTSRNISSDRKGQPCRILSENSIRISVGNLRKDWIFQL